MPSMPRPTLRLLPLALAAAFASLPAQAQSLIELYDAARAYDASWQSARAQFESAKARAEQARAGLLPTLSASATGSSSQLDSSTAGYNKAYDTQSGSITASQPLFRPANWSAFVNRRHCSRPNWTMRQQP